MKFSVIEEFKMLTTHNILFKKEDIFQQEIK